MQGLDVDQLLSANEEAVGEVFVRYGRRGSLLPLPCPPDSWPLALHAHEPLRILEDRTDGDVSLRPSVRPKQGSNGAGQSGLACLVGPLHHGQAVFEFDPIPVVDTGHLVDEEASEFHA